jgi:hypothetical protein
MITFQRQHSGRMKVVHTQEEEARRKFSEHVQSIAFNLTLSRRMISLLQTVRDYGFPGDGIEQKKRSGEVTMTPNGSHQYIMFSRALQNRGLIIHKWPVPKGDPTLVLSRSGELICELLVEAGLMPKKRLKNRE